MKAISTLTKELANICTETINKLEDKKLNAYISLTIFIDLDAGRDVDTGFNVDFGAQTPDIPTDVGAELDAGFSRSSEKNVQSDSELIFDFYVETSKRTSLTGSSD